MLLSNALMRTTVQYPSVNRHAGIREHQRMTAHQSPWVRFRCPSVVLALAKSLISESCAVGVKLLNYVTNALGEIQREIEIYAGSFSFIL